MLTALFSADFWGGNFWQGIGVMVSFASLLLSPLISMFFERLFGRKENQEYINAYKALALPDRPLTFGEWFLSLPIQAGASYALFILIQRVFILPQFDTNTLLTLSFGSVFVLTMCLSAIRRKSLARLLTWHLCLAIIVFCLFLIGLSWHRDGNAYITHDFSSMKHWIGQYLPTEVKQFPLIANLKAISLQTIPIDFKVASHAS